MINYIEIDPKEFITSMLNNHQEIKLQIKWFMVVFL